MKVLYEQAQSLIAEFEDAKIEHNLRHKNELADKLANLAMDFAEAQAAAQILSSWNAEYGGLAQWR